MSSRIEQKEARRAQRLAEEAARRTAEKRRRVRNIALSAVAIAAVLGGLTSLVAKGGKPNGQMVIGKPAPSFRVHNAVSNRDLTLEGVRGHKTLLFFSEGASCQACLVQAADLQKSAKLRRAGIRLVSISTDPKDVLHQVAGQYKLTTPLLADSNGAMSTAYGMIGKGGMGHPGADGHAFVLLDANGKVLWQQPYQSMYVPAKQLMHDMGQPAA